MSAIYGALSSGNLLNFVFPGAVSMSGQSPSPGAGAAHSPMGPPQQAPSPMPPPPQATSPAVGGPPQSPMGPPQVPSPMGPPGMGPSSGGGPPNGPPGPPGPPGPAGPHHSGGYGGGAGGWPPQKQYPGGPGQPPTGGGGGGYPPQESLNALQNAINTMEDKGLQGDPRYNDLLSMRAKFGMTGGPPQSGPPGSPYPGGDGSRPGLVTGGQMHQLRAQIMAYRCNARTGLAIFCMETFMLL